MDLYWDNIPCPPPSCTPARLLITMEVRVCGVGEFSKGLTVFEVSVYLFILWGVKSEWLHNSGHGWTQVYQVFTGSVNSCGRGRHLLLRLFLLFDRQGSILGEGMTSKVLRDNMSPRELPCHPHSDDFKDRTWRMLMVPRTGGDWNSHLITA